MTLARKNARKVQSDPTADGGGPNGARVPRRTGSVSNFLSKFHIISGHQLHASAQNSPSGQIFRRGSKMRKQSAGLAGAVESQEVVLKEAFKLFDKDNDGTITHEELRSALKTLGQDVTDDAVADLMGEVDVDGDQCIGFDEFKEMINSIEEKENIAYNAYIDETFKEFDVDSDDLITVRDLRYTLRKLGLECTFEEVGGIILDSLKDVKAQRERAARQRMPELSHELDRRESKPHTRTLTRTNPSSAVVDELELEGVAEEEEESEQDSIEEIVSGHREPGVRLEELRVIAKNWPRPICL